MDLKGHPFQSDVSAEAVRGLAVIDFFYLLLWKLDDNMGRI